MGIEKSLADRRGKEFCELTEQATTNGKSKKNRRRNKKMTPVQRLFDTCREIFAFTGTGIVPANEDIERLQAVLDDIRPADVGLSPNMRYFRATGSRGRPPITYLHIYECDKFSMGIFWLPPSGVIPLHDHPGMTVFSKLLFGTIHIKSYDWVVDSNASQTPPGVRLAKVKVDSDFTAPCSTSILYPADGGNMHCFTAVTACAVLDVLGPPYSDVHGRHCTYYLDFPFADFSADGLSVPEGEEGGYAWLQEREEIDDLTVAPAMYTGPAVMES